VSKRPDDHVSDARTGASRSGITRRRLLGQAGLATGALALGPLILEACTTPAGTQPTTSQANASPAQGGTLTVALGAFPATMSETEGGAPVQSQLMTVGDCMLALSPENKLGPNLAESWKLVDPLTWEFKLRSGIKFHNGEPLNAQAVKYTYDRALDPKNNFSRRVRLSLVSSTEAPDDLTVRVKTSSPFPLLAYGTSQIPIEPPGFIAQNGVPTYEKQPIGTGPFKLVEWTPNQRIVYDANKDYWGERPKVDHLIFKYIPDNSTRLAALQAGEVDIIDQVPIDLAAGLQTATTKVASVNILAGLALTFNLLEDGPLRNLKVRQAIDMAIDRNTLFSLYKSFSAILDGQITTKGSFGYNPNLKATAFDPTTAKRLLGEAGYATGITVDLNGPVNKYAADRDLVLAIAEQLKNVGVKTNVNIMEYAAYSTLRRANKLSGMHLIGWYNDGDAENAMISYSHPGTGQALSTFTDFDDTLNKARIETTPAAREQLLQQAAALMNSELPATMLFQLPSVFGVAKRVNGFVPRQDGNIIDLNKVSVA
jgi:peptide/nickel transport system substrate-binding protein